MEEMKKESADINNEIVLARPMYFPELDGLRFFAFLLVFINHHTLFTKIPYLSFLASHGWIGVDLFFALSAFLFTRLLIAENEKTSTISFKKFYIRRIFRIWPVYFLMVVIALFLNRDIIQQALTTELRIRILGLLTFTDNIMCVFYAFNPLKYTSHLWTIAYEEQFYIFIPLLIYRLVRSTVTRKLIWLALAFLLFNLIRMAMIHWEAPYPTIWVLPVSHFESILLGTVVGFGGFDFLLEKTSSFLFGLTGLLALILLCNLPNVNVNSFWLLISYTSVGLITSLTLFLVLKNDLCKKFLSHNFFVFLGKRSYGLYLYHLLGNGFATLAVSRFRLFPSETLASFIYSLIFTIAASLLSYWLIETPFLRMKKKFEVIVSRPI